MRLIQTIKGFGGKAGPVTKAVFSGEATPLPGCPDVVVSHAVYRMSGEEGYGKAANKERLCQLRELGYSLVLCTVESGNARQKAVLVAGEWLEVAIFKNKRTKHIVHLFVYHL